MVGAVGVLVGVLVGAFVGGIATHDALSVDGCKTPRHMPTGPVLICCCQ